MRVLRKSNRSILMLVTNPAVTDPRVARESKALAARGFAVTVVGWDRDGSVAADERLDGVRLFRVQAGRPKAFEMSSVAARLPLWYARAVALGLRLGPFGAIHCHDLDTVPVGSFLTRLTGARLVYDLHDRFEVYFRAPVLRRLTRRIERWACHRADGVVIVSEPFREIPWVGAKPCVTIMNTPESDGAGICEQTDLGYYYVGEFTPVKDMRYLLPWLAANNVTATFAGYGPLYEAHRRVAGGSTRFMGKVTPVEAEALMKRAFAALCLYDPKSPQAAYIAGNKLFLALKYGKPVIVTRKTHHAEIVEKYKCGMAVQHGDPVLFSTVHWILQEPNLYREKCQNAYEAYRKEFSWELMADRLACFYERMLL